MQILNSPKIPSISQCLKADFAVGRRHVHVMLPGSTSPSIVAWQGDTIGHQLRRSLGFLILLCFQWICRNSTGISGTQWLLTLIADDHRIIHGARPFTDESWIHDEIHSSWVFFFFQWFQCSNFNVYGSNLSTPIVMNGYRTSKLKKVKK